MSSIAFLPAREIQQQKIMICHTYRWKNKICINYTQWSQRKIKNKNKNTHKKKKEVNGPPILISLLQKETISQ